MTAPWTRIEELLGRALDLPEVERSAFVATESGDDLELRLEVESLLACVAGARPSLEAAIAEAAASLADAEATSYLGKRLGPYRLVELIGEGGMGTVYLAEREDAQFRKVVAIKILRAGQDSPRLVARFRDERQLLATLDHPGIVRMLDGGTTDDGMPYLVMERVDGVSLTTYARSRSVRERVELVVAVADAVQYAHQKLVVHRDLKPSNVLVDAAGAPKLLDFGIAKLLDGADDQREAHTRTGMALFTVEYASPEQVRGEPVSVSTDVYSLGAVLYDLLAGRPPQTEGASPLETLELITTRDPPRPSTVAPALRRELAGDLDNIVMKALQKRADRRYASVAELADDLRRYLDSRPVRARDATVAYRARKFVARHRGKLAIAVAIASALVAMTLVAVVQARHARAETERAERQTRTLIGERGWQELTSLHAQRALPYLIEALREGDDTPALRFLIAEASRPIQRQLAAFVSEGGFTGIAWSDDGARIATTERGGHARVYDANGRPLARIDVATDWLRFPIFAPNSHRLAAGDGAGFVYVWDDTGALQFSADVLHADRDRVATMTGRGVWSAITALVFTGDRVVAGGLDGSITVLDGATGTSLVRIAAGSDDDWVTGLAVSPDGRRIASGMHGGAVLLWDAATGSPLARLVGHSAEVTVLRFTRDGARLYTASDDATIRIWSVDRGEPLEVLSGHTALVCALDLSADENELVSGSDDQTARVWDARTGALQQILVGHTSGSVIDVSFSRDGKQVATAGRDDTYRVWNTATGATELVLEAREGAGAAAHAWAGAFRARFSPDGRQLLTLSGTGAELWRNDRAPLLSDLAVSGSAYAAALSPDERRVAAVGYGFAEVHELAGGPAIPLSTDPRAIVWDVGWSPDGARVVIAGNDGLAHVHDAGGALVLALVGHHGTVNRASFSPDGRWIATAGDDRTARIWDAATGQEQRALPHGDRVLAAAWSRDGLRLATAGWDHAVRVWDPARGDLLATLDTGTAQCLDVTFSPDRRALVAGCHGGEVYVFDLATGARTLFEGHTAAATNAVWSPDGSFIATSGDDHTARIWDAATGKLLATRLHPTSVMSVQWSRDGTRIVTAATDGIVRTWDVHVDHRSVAELSAFAAAHVPFRLVGTRLEHSDDR